MPSGGGCDLVVTLGGTCSARAPARAFWRIVRSFGGFRFAADCRRKNVERDSLAGAVNLAAFAVACFARMALIAIFAPRAVMAAETLAAILPLGASLALVRR